ncbi:hypothetical protein ACYULU_01160 [Breznakiellaceae bacterium SP9]
MKEVQLETKIELDYYGIDEREHGKPPINCTVKGGVQMLIDAQTLNNKRNCYSADDGKRFGKRRSPNED